ncbi:RDD family protein [uncultured Corynebacterium sp.]|uniref:RDD family protein n=1 Tax=uncultured Corynebacterium sp. TaxID=159447 RepID=UPI0025D778D7|nr:RDD family protein [uncultured Corynebacterium sp.]
MNRRDERGLMDPFVRANPYEADPFAPPTAAAVPVVARTPVPADHPLLGVPRNPKITPATAAAAEALGYDPTAVNAPINRRLGALLIDGAAYVGLLAMILVLLGIFGPAGSVATGAVTALLLGPAGFYGYRAMGDAVFEGSPGKHAMGLRMGGPNGLPVSGTDGLRRNLWILPSMVPVLGWLATLAMMGWIGLSAGNDPLGRGGHERAIGTRVTEKD